MNFVIFKNYDSFFDCAKQLIIFAFHLHCKKFYVKPLSSWVIIRLSPDQHIQGKGSTRVLMSFELRQILPRNQCSPSTEKHFLIEAKQRTAVLSVHWFSLTMPWGTRLVILTMFSTCCFGIIFLRWCSRHPIELLQHVFAMSFHACILSLGNVGYEFVKSTISMCEFLRLIFSLF